MDPQIKDYILIDFESLPPEERVAIEIKSARLDYLIAIYRARSQYKKARAEIQDTCVHKMSHDLVHHKENTFRRCDICGFMQHVTTQLHVVK